MSHYVDTINNVKYPIKVTYNSQCKLCRKKGIITPL